MIVYEAKVSNFLKDVQNPTLLSTLISNKLLDKRGIKVSPSEKRSWQISLPQMSKLIQVTKNDFRVVLCEFNIPINQKRVDFVILGKDVNKKPSAWIVELKQWSDSNILEESTNQFRISNRYLSVHPSEQAFDYESTIKHVLGLTNKVNIKSSAYLPNLNKKDSCLFNKGYENILEKVWSFSNLDKEELAKSIENHTIIKDGGDSLKQFKKAGWKPSKTFKQYISEDMKSLKLVGSQNQIYRNIINLVKSKGKKTKVTFLVSGTPGSGKTVVAFKLAMHLMKKLNKAVQLMLPGQEVRKAFQKKWQDKKLVDFISGASLRKGFNIAIIDEAHKAISRDTGIVNYERIYEKLKMGIIFIDDDQVINKRGITKNNIKKIAKENSHDVYEYKIEENFRNFGERTLIDWIDHVFYSRKTSIKNFEYEQKYYVNKTSNYKLYGYKSGEDFISAYKNYFENNNETTRITSLWHKGFYIGNADENGHVIRNVNVGKYFFAWNPNEEWWKRLTIENKKTYNDYVKKFVEDRSSFLIGQPKKEYIAYFNHIQGYEFENIFVYIPKVFTLENNEIRFHRNRLADEVKGPQTWNPKSKSKSVENKNIYEENKRFFLNRIKVMLTRGTKSTHVFAEDENLNQYIRKHIK